eukprot:g2209.t1
MKLSAVNMATMNNAAMHNAQHEAFSDIFKGVLSALGVTLLWDVCPKYSKAGMEVSPALSSMPGDTSATMLVQAGTTIDRAAAQLWSMVSDSPGTFAASVSPARQERAPFAAVMVSTVDKAATAQLRTVVDAVRNDIDQKRN